MNLPDVDVDVDEDAQALPMGAGHDPVVDFHFALVDVVGLSEQQANSLIAQDISTASELSYIDDVNLMGSFMEHDKPTAGTRARLLAFKSWSKEHQSIHGFGNVDATKFNLEQLNIVLMKKATATKRGSDDISPPLYGPGKEAWKDTGLEEEEERIPCIPCKEAWIYWSAIDLPHLVRNGRR